MAPAGVTTRNFRERPAHRENVQEPYETRRSRKSTECKSSTQPSHRTLWTRNARWDACGSDGRYLATTLLGHTFRDSETRTRARNGERTFGRY